MVEYTKNQLQIAASLVKSSKTMEELREELDMPMGVLENELAGLIKLKVVEQSGYPTKYSVVEMVRRGIMGENDTTEKPFTAHAIIEGQSRNKEELVKATKNLIEKLKTDKLVAIADLKEDEIVEGGGYFTTNFEVNIATKTFEDMMYFVLSYGPTSVELTGPKEFDIKLDEAQGIVMDVATTIHSYIGMIAQLKVMMQDSDRVYIKDPKSKV